MRVRTALILLAIAAGVVAAAYYYAVPPARVTRGSVAAPGTLAFPGLAATLSSATRVEITAGGKTIAIARTGEVWGLADRGGYPVQPDKLRELLTGLTELRFSEPRTADPALLERLGLGDPASATSAATLVRVTGDTGPALAELVVGHRRVRPQGNLPESVYVRRPGENQSWLAEGHLPADTDPQLWLTRDIANIESKEIAAVVVHRGDTVLEFGRDGDKPVLKSPAAHPKLDDYRVEDVFRALETLTLTDVKPAAQQPGAPLGTATLTTSDGTVVEATISALAKTDAKEPGAKDIWVQISARGDSDTAKKLAARVTGWAYQIGAWKEKAFLPTLDDLKSTVPEPVPPAGDEKKPE